MAISIKKYVDITSGTNNIQTATEKELIARFFTTNSKCPTNAVELDSLKDVGTFFGTDSEEYKVSSIYFNFVNKYQRQPKKVSFFRDFTGGIKGFITGTEAPVLAELKTITAGKLKISINGIVEETSALDLSAVTDMSDVASILQDAVQALTADEFASATVTYSVTNKVFTLELGIKSNAKVELISTPLSVSLKWDIVSDGYADTATVEDVLEASYQNSNNFGTFAFISVQSSDDIVKIAKANRDLHPSEFMFVAQVDNSNYSTIQELVKDVDGISLELCNSGEAKYNFVIPMAITATTDYNKENGTQNYMYQQIDGVGIIVDDDNTAYNLDRKLVNYYGRTQQAGQKIAFYQNGVMQGDYQDQSVFMNEVWLKDALTTKFINYFLVTPNWYANKAGQGIGNGLAFEVIDRAKINGTITTEKELTDIDKVYIYNITNDENAWRQVYMEGYYFMSSINKEVINNQVIYKFNYTLVYSKGDSIKKVEGRNILI